MDPSPFIEKDLDDKAEEFILGWAQEFPHEAPLKLYVQLDQWPAEDPTELIREAVHNHFAHRAEVIQLEFKILLKQARTSLLIGLSCVAPCLIIIKTLLPGETGTLGRRLAGEPDHCSLGRDVAPDANISLRLVASASPKPDLR